MRTCIILLLISPLFLATQCFDDDCITLENLETEETYVYNMSISPYKSVYQAGDTLTYMVNLPARNDFVGSEIDMFEESGGRTALFVTTDNLFYGNRISITKGEQGPFSNQFTMFYNINTKNYELEILITLDRSGNYSVPNNGHIEIGGSRCPDYKINLLFENTIRYDEHLKFSVIEE